jgi:hypothetical protein
MSIADRVKESIDKYNSNDLENARIQTCIALDGTARNEFPRINKNARRFKAFVNANMTSSLSSHSIRMYSSIAGLENTPLSNLPTRYYVAA